MSSTGNNMRWTLSTRHVLRAMRTGCSTGGGVGWFAVAALVCLLSDRVACAQVDFERPPIDYLTAPVHDAIADLQAKLDTGSQRLAFDAQSGYLRSLLMTLDIQPSSQVLVFSKTSFQQSKITARRPRALYFNDNVYIGWVQRGDVIEVSSIDPQQGAVFYTLSQEEGGKPRFNRQTHNCLVCHGSSQTRGVPGSFVRSVYPDRSGRPVLSAGTYRTDYTSPLSERWGGWYVSGTHGKQRHMGNVTVTNRSEPEKLDVEAGANITDLDALKLLNVSPYLTPHSDIVALMVLEHQVAMHNVITAANYSARITLRDAKIMNDALQRDADHESDSTRRRFDSAARKVVDLLLLVGEYALTDPIVGTSGFAKDFQRRGPFDKQGRSLRALDLKKRLFQYPCSYLIYSDAFAALPKPVKHRVLRKLWEVLSGSASAEKYQHLSPDDRVAIREILVDTMPDLPEYWTRPQGSKRR